MKPTEIHNPEEVLFLKGVVNYTEVYLRGGKKEVSCTTLKRYEESLSDFVRVSKSHLVNPKHIAKVNFYGEQSYLVMKSGRQVNVSRRRKAFLKSQMVENA
ncbi:LytR/AlgR family response regulator transcription factor [Jiulongibacter sp. NS-SX5]|uniref:LytR/AlgR family response regulator transcription factor n=1 Tax=Jiulongibacter sp. NS-SX5 TaxID=3463854 RepID=UPI004059E52C